MGTLVGAAWKQGKDVGVQAEMVLMFCLGGEESIASPRAGIVTLETQTQLELGMLLIAG